jgi:hypothetical protein
MRELGSRDEDRQLSSVQEPVEGITLTEIRWKNPPPSQVGEFDRYQARAMRRATATADSDSRAECTRLVLFEVSSSSNSMQASERHTAPESSGKRHATPSTMHGERGEGLWPR